MMLEALQYEFMRNALLAGLLASTACGIVGTFVVINRIVFISGGIAHAAYGGIGLALFFGFSYTAGILGFSLFVAFLMAAVSLRAKQRADAVIGVLWAVGMAVGVILLDLKPGYNVDLMGYLFGSILTVPTRELLLILALDGIIVAVVFYFYHDLVALSYDEEFARIRGVHSRLLYFVLIGLTALTVVMVIRVVGLILVIALLTISPYIAERFARSVGSMIVVSVILNFFFTTIGLWVSYAFDLTSGATIILVGGVGFFFFLLLDRILKRLWTY
jgi:zinc transport system permease protein